MKKSIIFLILFFISILSFKIIKNKIMVFSKKNLIVLFDSESYFEKEISCFEKKMIKRNNKRKIVNFFKKYIYGYFLKITFRSIFLFFLFDTIFNFYFFIMFFRW